MVTLATVADVETRIGRVLTTEADTARVQALLEDASAAVQLYTRRLFGTGTVTRRVRPRSGVIRLPRGIDNIDSVVAYPGGEALTYTWDGLTQLAVTNVDRFDYEPRLGNDPVEVTYSWDNEVPAIVKAVTAQMAARAFGVKPDTAGIQQQSIAGYSYSVGAVAAAGAVGMLAEERAALAPFRINVGTAWVAMAAPWLRS